MVSGARRPSLSLMLLPAGRNTILSHSLLSPLWLNQAIKGNIEIQPVGTGTCPMASACVETVWLLAPQPGLGKTRAYSIPTMAWNRAWWQVATKWWYREAESNGSGGKEEAVGRTRNSHAVQRGWKVGRASCLGFLFFFSFLSLAYFCRSLSMKAGSCVVLSRLSYLLI